MHFSSDKRIAFYNKKDQTIAMFRLICLYVMFVNALYRFFERMFYKLIYERKGFGMNI